MLVLTAFDVCAYEPIAHTISWLAPIQVMSVLKNQRRRLLAEQELGITPHTPLSQSFPSLRPNPINSALATTESPDENVV